MSSVRNWYWNCFRMVIKNLIPTWVFVGFKFVFWDCAMNSLAISVVTAARALAVSGLARPTIEEFSALDYDP